MRPAAEKVRAWLASLSHEEVLESPGTHSQEGPEDARRPFWHSLQGLGLRRRANLAGVHGDALARASRDLAGARGPDELALAGRVSQLLGRGPEARELLRRSLAAAENPEAAAWLGELELLESAGEAEALLGRALALRPGWEHPRLRRALLWSRRGKAAAALKEVEDAASRGGSVLAGLLRARLLLAAGRAPEALAAALAAARAAPGSPAAPHLAGWASHAAGDLAGALRHFHRARDLDLDVQGAYFSRDLGLSLTWEDPRAYLAALDAAVRRSPRAAILYAERAELKRDPRICRYDEALEDYERAAALAPRTAWIAAVLGRARNNRSGGEAGLEEFARAARLCPESGWIRAWRGAALARLGRRPEALSEFKAAEERMPWYPFTFAWRGALHNRSRRAAAARRDLDAAIRLDGQYPFSFYERFAARRALGDAPGALDDLAVAFRADPKFTWLGARASAAEARRALRSLEEAARRHPRLAWLKAWLGHCLLMLGRSAEAAAALDAAVDGGARDPVVFAWRGWARRDQGRAAEAVRDLAAAARREPSLWLAHKLLAELHAAAGRPRQALAAMERVTRLAPTTAPHWVARARLEAGLGLHVPALESLSRATQLDRGFSEAHVLCAQIELERGEAARAAEAAQRAIAGREVPGLAYLVRGLARQKLGDFSGQREDFRKALELAPELFPAAERSRVLELTGGGGHGG